MKRKTLTQVLKDTAKDLGLNMKSFKEYAIKFNYIEEQRDENITGADFTFGLISEASLSRLWDMSKNSDFAIITAYRNENSKKENVLHNKELRDVLNSKKLGSYSLIGHWREAPEGKEYDKVAPEELTDVVERSYFVTRNKDISPEEFRDLIISLAKKYKQDGVILKIEPLDMFGIYKSLNGMQIVKFNKGVSFNKVAQGFSQYVRKKNVPIVFEGVETPSGGLCWSYDAARKNGFLWLFEKKN